MANKEVSERNRDYRVRFIKADMRLMFQVQMDTGWTTRSQPVAPPRRSSLKGSSATSPGSPMSPPGVPSSRPRNVHWADQIEEQTKPHIDLHSPIYHPQKGHQHPMDKMAAASGGGWNLVDCNDSRTPLPSTMLFLGRDTCDVQIQSRSVDKRHAVFNYDSLENHFKVKDLGSQNGTYVNEKRIPEQEYITLANHDTLRFGYDPMLYHMEKVDDPVSGSLCSADSDHQVSSADGADMDLSSSQDLPSWAARDSLLAAAAAADTSTLDSSLNALREMRRDVTSQRDATSQRDVTASMHSQRDVTASIHSHTVTTQATREVTTTQSCLAECSGCIAEQGLRHTCTTGEEPQHHHHQHQHPPQYPHQQPHLTRSASTGGISNGHGVPGGGSKWQSHYHPAYHSGYGYAVDHAATDTNASDTQGANHLHEFGIPAPGQSPRTPSCTGISSSGTTGTVPAVGVAPLGLHPPVGSDGKPGVHLVASYVTPEKLVSHSGGEHTYCQVIHHCVYPSPPPPPPQHPYILTSHPPPYDNITYTQPANTTSFPRSNSAHANLGGVQAQVVVTPRVSAQGRVPEECPVPSTVTVTRTQSPSSAPPEHFNIPCTLGVMSSPTDDLPTRDVPTRDIPADTAPVTTCYQHQKPGLYRSTSETTSDESVEQEELITHHEANGVNEDYNTSQEELITHHEVNGVNGVRKAYHTQVNGSHADHTDYADATDPLSNTYPGSPPVPRRDQRRSAGGAESDLETVKKATPLYGLPSWWGDKDTEDLPQDDPNGGAADRPDTLTLAADKRKATNGVPQQGTHTPPERDTGPGVPDSEAQTVTEPTSFTIDFSPEEAVGAKPSMTSSLSNLLPNKLRKSFRDRSNKSKEKRERDKDNLRKESDEEGSPVLQRRAVSTTGTTWRARRAQSPRKNGYHSDGHNSISSDNEDLSVRSDTSTVKERRKSTHNMRSSRDGKDSKSGQRTTGVRPVPSAGTPTTRRRSTPQATTSSHASDRKSTASTRTSSVAEPPEYALYKEAKTYNTKHRSTPPQPTVSQAEPKHTVRKSGSRVKSSGGGTPKPPEGDNTSETGTYTVQSEQEQEELSKARESIEQLFCVTASEDTDQDVDNVPEDEVAESPPPGVSDSMQAEVGSAAEQVCEVISPQWVKQWAVESAAYTVAPGSPARVTPGEIHFTGHDTVPVKQQVISTTQKPVAVTSTRKTRPGSGRRLPSPPMAIRSSTNSPQILIISDSPRGSPRSSFDFKGQQDREEDLDDDSGRHRATVTFDSDDGGGKFTVSFDAPQSAPKRTTPRLDDPAVSELFVSEEVTGRTRSDSARSTGSMDTQVLLKDTEHVMQAMVERMAKRQQNGVSPTQPQDYCVSPLQADDLTTFRPVVHEDTDSDGSSTHAVVEADVDLRGSGRRTTPRNTRQGLSKSQSVVEQRKPPTPRSMTRDAPPIRRQPQPVNTRNRQPLNTTFQRSKSVGRDYGPTSSQDYSESEASSIISSSTDYSESMGGSPKSPRRGGHHQQKRPTSQPKTNRTLMLRRAQRMDSDTESSTITRSRPSSAGCSMDSPRSTPARSRSTSRNRPSSAKETSRTERSDVSLGQKIVQKSRENGLVAGRAPPSAVSRKDGGRHSLRSSQMSSGSSVVSSVTSHQSTSTSRRSVDSRPRHGTASRPSPVQNLRASGGPSTLTITGNKSQPAVRTTSPQTDSFSAWKRRKDYDPRRAVIESKTPKGKSHAAHDINRSARARSVTTADEYDSRGHLIPQRSASSVSSEEQSFASEDNSRCDDVDRIRIPDEQLDAWTLSNREYFEQYDAVVKSSIRSLAEVNKMQTEHILHVLKEQNYKVSRSPSPGDHRPMDNADPVLSETLAFLQRTRSGLQAITKALTANKDSSSEVNIRPEVMGFKPIETPKSSRPVKQWGLTAQGSMDSEPLDGDEYY